MKLAGVVVLYNPDSDIKENILSYLTELDVLYVVDNNRDEHNFNLLPESQKIVYLANYENKGVSFALNLGASCAIDAGFKWMLTMDQDSKFKEGQIQQMISFIENNNDENIGLVSPWHCTNAKDKKPSVDIEFPLEVMTSGNIINLSIYKQVGGFKDWLFIDCVDFDYCMNLNVQGFKVARLNYIEMQHQLGDIKVVKILGRNLVCSNHNYIRRYYIVRNIFYICDMYGEFFPEYCSFIKRGLKGGLQNIILFEKNKFKKVKYMYKGFRDYKKGIKGILKD